MKTKETKVQDFVNLINKCGNDWSPENVLKCIAFAKEAMQKGECSVESYYTLKKILIQKLNVVNGSVN